MYWFCAGWWVLESGGGTICVTNWSKRKHLQKRKSIKLGHSDILVQSGDIYPNWVFHVSKNSQRRKTNKKLRREAKQVGTNHRLTKPSWKKKTNLKHTSHVWFGCWKRRGGYWISPPSCDVVVGGWLKNRFEKSAKAYFGEVFGNIKEIKTGRRINIDEGRGPGAGKRGKI